MCLIPTATTLQHPSQQSRLDTISLPYCDNFVEASRVSAQYINEAFTGLTIRTTLDIRGIQLKPQQLVRVSSERYSFSQKLFQVKEIDELQEGTVLTYRVLLREYEPSNYTDDGTIQEEDPAPNIDFMEPSQIAAVSTLSVIEVNASAAIPNFTLQWQVPVSLIDEFDVFFSTSTNFSTASRLRTVTSPGGPFSSGSVVQEIITGLATGTYSFWVIGRNQFGRSAESNRADQVWNPIVEPGTTIIRHNDNPVTMDPGAPTGTEGTGGGWYDPVEGSTITTNVPADPNPHWEAIAENVSVTGLNRVVEFTFDGVGATTVDTPVPQQQEYTFEVTGTPGAREVVHGPRPEITDVTLTGTAANFHTGEVGIEETWNLSVDSGSSDADGSARSGEYYIHMTGMSGGVDTRNTVYTGPTNLTWVRTTVGTNPVVPFFNQQAGAIGDDAERGFHGPGDFNITIGRLNLGAGGNTALETILAGIDGVVTSTPFDSFPGLTEFDFSSLGDNRPRVRIEDADGNIAEAIVTNVRSRDATLGAIDAQDGQVDFRYSSSGGTAQNPVAGAELIRNDTGFFNQDGVTLTLDAITGPASVNIQIPTESINETYGLAADLTTNLALRDNLLTSLQASTVITDEFTVSGTTSSGISGLVDGEPIIRLVANDTITHTFNVAFNNNNGNIGGSSFGTLVTPAVTTVQSQIRVAFDSNISPTNVDIQLGASANPTAIASLIATALNSHAQLTASSMDGNVTVTTVAEDDFTPPTITLTTPGTTDNQPTFTVTTTQNGRNPSDAPGSASSYSVLLGTAPVTSGSFSSNADSAQAAMELSAAIDASTLVSATVDGSIVTVTTAANTADDLSIIITAGTNGHDLISPNNLADTLTITQTGSAVDVFGGTDGNIEVFVGLNSILNMSIAGMTTNQIANLINTTYVNDNAYTSTIMGDIVSLIATFTGTDDAARIVVMPGVRSDGTVADLAVTRTVINDGSDVIMRDGVRSAYTIAVGGTTVSTGDFENSSTSAQAANTLVQAFLNVNDYDASSVGPATTATSTFRNNTPDVIVTITQGTSSGANPPPTIMVSRMVLQEGSAPVLDLESVEWRYYTINQEIRVDDDSVEMMSDNTITVPRGLFVDAEQIDGRGTGTIIAAETYSTAAHRSNLIVSGGVSEPVLITNTGTAIHVHTFDYSIDGGTTWIPFFTTGSFDPNFGGVANGQIFNNIQFVGTTIQDIPASSTVSFRVRDTGTANMGNYGFGILIIEERNVDMTTM